MGYQLRLSMIAKNLNFGMRRFFYFSFLFIFSFCFNLYSQETVEKKSEYLPDIDGIIKTKAEFDLENTTLRFEVRNARFGAKGKINDYMSYKVEMDLSDEGKFKVMDVYVRFTPVANLDFFMGQRKIPFSTDHMRSPADNFFANRSFLAKYINEGMRDIGFYTAYKITGRVPVDMIVGVVNGTGNNNPQWVGKPNLAARATVGPDKGFRVAGNLYYGNVQDQDHLALFGGELRFTNGSLLVESEYISKNWTDTLSVRNHEDGMYFHSYYNFNLNKKMIYMITPTARWDFIGNSVFENKIEASRLTFGVNIGFEPKQFYSEIRLNYENYLKSSLPIHTDKLTLEFIARF
jgi:hypothetical protein